MTRFHHIAVLMGGWSAERDVSLVSGAACADALEKSGYKVTRIDVTRDLPALITALTPKPDAVFNALHGKGGEDGVIQGVLEMLQIPYTHSGVLACAIGMDKPLTKKLLAGIGVQSPNGIVINRAQLEETRIPFQPPYVIKPASEGSSVGVHIVRPGDNRPIIEDWLAESDLLIEEYIPGKELTVGVQGMSGEPAKALGVTDIIPSHEFFDYESKYTAGGAIHKLPADVPDTISNAVKTIAVMAHETLGCSGISRTDFRWDDSKPGTTGLYFLEINTHPGFTPFSLVPEQAAYLGMSFAQLVTGLIEGARCHA